jgi:hypothetical protein
MWGVNGTRGGCAPHSYACRAAAASPRGGQNLNPSPLGGLVLQHTGASLLRPDIRVRARDFGVRQPSAVLLRFRSLCQVVLATSKGINGSPNKIKKRVNSSVFIPWRALRQGMNTLEILSQL